jgi:hypothetical protein
LLTPLNKENYLPALWAAIAYFYVFLYLVCLKVVVAIGAGGVDHHGVLELLGFDFNLIHAWMGVRLFQ